MGKPKPGKPEKPRKPPRKDKTRKPRQKDKTKKQVIRGQEFLCNTLYHVSLPSFVSVQPKSLHYPIPADSLTNRTYSGSSLDYSNRLVLPLDPLQTIPINLIDPLAYAVPEGVSTHLSPVDFALLRPPDGTDGRNKIDWSASWLKDTSDRYTRSFFTESFVQKSARDNVDPHSFRESQELRALPAAASRENARDTSAEEEMAAAGDTLVHCRDKSLVPIQILPLVPCPALLDEELEDHVVYTMMNTGPPFNPESILLDTSHGVGLYCQEDPGVSEFRWKALYQTIDLGKEAGGVYLSMPTEQAEQQQAVFYSFQQTLRLKKWTQSQLQRSVISEKIREIPQSLLK